MSLRIIAFNQAAAMLTDHEINPIWTPADRAAIAELAAATQMSPNIVIREALRLYQSEVMGSPATSSPSAPGMESTSFVPTEPGIGYDIQTVGDTVTIFIHSGPEHERDGICHSGGVVAALRFDEAAFRRFRDTIESAFRHFEGMDFERRWTKTGKPYLAPVIDAELATALIDAAADLPDADDAAADGLPWGDDPAPKVRAAEGA